VKLELEVGVLVAVVTELEGVHRGARVRGLKLARILVVEASQLEGRGVQVLEFLLELEGLAVGRVPQGVLGVSLVGEAPGLGNGSYSQRHSRARNRASEGRSTGQ